MKCSSKKNLFSVRSFGAGFSLPEAMAALLILSIICSGVFVIIERSVKAAADMEIRMHAFEVAQQNMEKILCTRPVTEEVDYGISEIYPSIEWTTSVEVFGDPEGGWRMWVKAVCSAEYRDTEDVLQKIEFTHWISQLTKAQIDEYLGRQEGILAGQLLLTIEDAAEYAEVGVDTIMEWESNGMEKYEDQYVKMYLDLYKGSGGHPTAELKKQVEDSFKVLLMQSGDSVLPEETPLPDDPNNLGLLN